mmetsp:Transcript_39100/g.70101  ORF Transcript_39100/g.70101 Transcript_39100/m.70101 type:complete len:88 (-) Transcript_39100:30-293(-)
MTSRDKYKILGLPCEMLHNISNALFTAAMRVAKKVWWMWKCQRLGAISRNKKDRGLNLTNPLGNTCLNPLLKMPCSQDNTHETKSEP